MSLNLNPDALAAARETLRQRNDGLTSARQTATDDEGLSFADQMRARQVRSDQTRADLARKDDVERPEAANNNTPAQPAQEAVQPADQAEARPVQAEKPDANTAEQAQAAPEDQFVSQPVETIASEAVTAEAVTQSATQPTPEALLVAAQTVTVAAPSPDAKAPSLEGVEAKPAVAPAVAPIADVADDAPVAAVVTAMTDLKSALKTELAAKTAADGETDKAAEPEITDAKLTELMQALLGGKPLTPELKALSETPKVAEALKGVRNAMALLDQTPQTKTPDAALALTAKTEGQAAKPTVDVKTTESEPDLKLGNLLDGKPVAPQAPAAETASQTAKPSPANPSATLATPKPSEPVADFKPAPLPSETPVQVQTQADTKATETLQLKRTEAALGSSLSTTALNNLTQMSAHIARHMTAKSTQFNMELHPADMGRVDVKLSINHDGTLSAAMSFDSPVAESQFRAQADDLRRQLEAQGFQLAEGSLSFSSRQESDQANQGQTSGNNSSAFADEAPDVARAAQAFGAFDQTPDAQIPGALLAQKLGLDLLGAQTYRLSLNVTA